MIIKGVSPAEQFKKGAYVFYDNMSIYNPTVYSEISKNFTSEAQIARRAEYSGATVAKLRQQAAIERQKEVNVLIETFKVKDLTMEKFGSDPRAFYKQVTEALTEALGLKSVAKYGLDIMRQEGWKENQENMLGKSLNTAKPLMEKIRKQFIKSITSYLSKRGVELIEAHIDDLTPAFKQIEADIEKIFIDVSKNIIGTYYQQMMVKSDGKEQEIYQQLYNEIMSLPDENPLIQGIKREFHLDDLAGKLKKQAELNIQKNKRKITNKSQLPTGFYSKVHGIAQVNYQRAGIINELVISALQKGMTSMRSTDGGVSFTVRTGDQGNQKADETTILDIKINPDIVMDILTSELDLKGANDSVRIANANRLKELYEALPENSTVIFQNEKTSTLKGTKSKNYNWDGFSAGDAITFPRLRSLSSRLGVTNLNSTRFLRALLNSSKETINGAANSAWVKSEVAQALSIFLFDDVDAMGADIVRNAGGKTTNFIHVLTLNNLAVPLSYFLEAAADSLAEAVDNSNKMFHVTMSSPKILYPNGGTSETTFEHDGKIIHGWTYNDWKTQKAYMEENIKFSIHFMNNFKSFIEDFGIFLG